MSWWSSLIDRTPLLSADQHAALGAFMTLPKLDLTNTIYAQRFVVVDVESSGLNLKTDRLIAIGAVTVADGAVCLNQGFEVVLQQTTPSAVDNILIHGIDGTTQTSGMEPAAALLKFLAFIGNSPLVAYHAPFDRTMIDRATKTFLGIKIRNPWVDLAHIAPALFPEIAGGRRALDDWTTAFGIVNTNRHNAVADALATAQLLLVLLARAKRQTSGRMSDLIQIEKAQQWLSR